MAPTLDGTNLRCSESDKKKWLKSCGMAMATTTTTTRRSCSSSAVARSNASASASATNKASSAANTNAKNAGGTAVGKASRRRRSALHDRSDNTNANSAIGTRASGRNAIIKLEEDTSGVTVVTPEPVLSSGSGSNNDSTGNSNTTTTNNNLDKQQKNANTNKNIAVASPDNTTLTNTGTGGATDASAKSPPVQTNDAAAVASTADPNGRQPEQPPQHQQPQPKQNTGTTAPAATTSEAATATAAEAAAAAAVAWKCHKCSRPNPLRQLRCPACRSWKGRSTRSTPTSTEGCDIVTTTATTTKTTMMGVADDEMNVEEEEKEKGEDRHGDDCEICGEGGELICCDGSNCSKVYHQGCIGVEDLDKLSDPWYCPSCEKDGIGSKTAEMAAAGAAGAATGASAVGTEARKTTAIEESDNKRKENDAVEKQQQRPHSLNKETEGDEAMPNEGDNDENINNAQGTKKDNNKKRRHAHNNDNNDDVNASIAKNNNEEEQHHQGSSTSSNEEEEEEEEGVTVIQNGGGSDGKAQTARGDENKTKNKEKEHNEDECYICDDGGLLVCCDYCDKSFHMQCHVPPLHEIPKGKWKCCECSASSFWRRFKCGSCDACLREDCGECDYCLDKPKFGGPNYRKQVCIHKKCPYKRFAPPATVTPEMKKEMMIAQRNGSKVEDEGMEGVANVVPAIALETEFRGKMFNGRMRPEGLANSIAAASESADAPGDEAKMPSSRTKRGRKSSTAARANDTTNANTNNTSTKGNNLTITARAVEVSDKGDADAGPLATLPSIPKTKCPQQADHNAVGERANAVNDGTPNDLLLCHMELKRARAEIGRQADEIKRLKSAVRALTASLTG
eukprot:CAMPEP_0183710218 /NCGR_PEP_ID=MMETSP0737-20130205/6009_1 /TAXON_ID=385413 /ORGANISM="Thalassiosira miniscula, Strain CCMP1093" /LENGTH=849 /DNA_ID=CAMNT_0025938447 /DNA_START=28 /DNA_END=2577 /DNA_ORIENTATION=+